ncbi:DsbE family thiol:disulfide interchange protein [Vibrio sp. CAU 1672]|uniref:DsbE family thiol:disulfide interchange protein n=1 Tax=Vibrio sp. CAU 1672 TaxID=3032594 RepID=UPI0023D98E84|nr:DsbE family thiol:disulfide interchange protein [Vibrio sp. CAU 1672]MDF2154301.1 DsbE family thiol:disulfide interchange protein [Vibrio sp. CAU 1672]
MSSKRNSLKLAGLVVAVIAFAAVSLVALSDKPQAVLSQPRELTVPQFSAVSLISGQAVSERLFKGEGYKLLNVWASWCGVCKRENDELLMLAQQGVKIIGLNYRDQSLAARNYLQVNHDPYYEVISDPNGSLAIELGVIGTPETYLVDQYGKILIKYRGQLTPEAWNDIFSGYFDVSI